MKVTLQNSHRSLPVNGMNTILNRGKSALVRIGNDFSNKTFGTIVRFSGENYSLIPRFGNIYVNDQYINKRVFLQHGDQIKFTYYDKTENYIFLIRDDDYVILPTREHPTTSKDSPKIIVA